MDKKHINHSISINIRKIDEWYVITFVQHLTWVILLREERISLLKAIHLLIIEQFLNVNFIVINVPRESTPAYFFLLLNKDIWHTVTIKVQIRIRVWCRKNISRRIHARWVLFMSDYVIIESISFLFKFLRN